MFFYAKEMLVAALLAVYVLWLGFELQVYGVRSGRQLGLFAGAGKRCSQPSVR